MRLAIHAGGGAGREAGTTALEFALVLPMFLLLVMGLVEFGNMCLTYVTVQKAVQMGARYAITGRGEAEGTRIQDIVNATRRLLPGQTAASSVAIRSWPGSNISGSGRSGDPGQPCDTVEVSVLHSYHPFVPLVSGLLPKTVTLSGADKKVNEPWRVCM